MVDTLPYTPANNTFVEVWHGKFSCVSQPQAIRDGDLAPRWLVHRCEQRCGGDHHLLRTIPTEQISRGNCLMTTGSVINRASGLAFNISTEVTCPAADRSPLSIFWNWDAPSAGDSTDMCLAPGVDSNAAYEICDKDYNG